MSRPAFLAAVLVLSLAGGCDRSGEDAGASQKHRKSRAERRDRAAREIDRLRALPYAGYAPGEPDNAGDGVVVYDRQRSHPGYNLYVMHERCVAQLMDAEERVLREWKHRPSQSWGNGELLPNGDFLVVGTDRSHRPTQIIDDDKRYVLRFNWEGELLWKRQLTAHHDIELTPRGQFLTLTFQRRIVRDFNPDIPVRDDRLTLLSQDGEVLETVSLYDVLSARPDVFRLEYVGPNTRGGTPWIDLFHCNSIEWMHHGHLEDRDPLYAPSNVLICFRHQNRIAIVNWDAREVVWAWGESELDGPHDAQVLESGNILVFDNGMGRKWSRVLELDPLRREIVWQYQAPSPQDFFTISKGANQRLPNGNTLITNSDRGQVFEITPGGEIVWEFWCRYKSPAGQRATIVRMKRYESAFVQRLLESSSQPVSAP